MRAAAALVMAMTCAAPVAQKSADPARGAAKAAPCASCHGSAQPAVPSLAGQPHEFLVLQMFYLREGLREVPAMAGLLQGFTDRDLEDVAAFYARQEPPRARAFPDARLQTRGVALARAMGCGSCHLHDYSGQKHVPRLAGQHEAYLAAALKAYRDNTRTGTDTSMNDVMYRVSDADIAALAHFLAHR